MVSDKYKKGLQETYKYRKKTKTLPENLKTKKRYISKYESIISDTIDYNKYEITQINKTLKNVTDSDIKNILNSNKEKLQELNKKLKPLEKVAFNIGTENALNSLQSESSELRKNTRYFRSDISKMTKRKKKKEKKEKTEKDIQKEKESKEKYGEFSKDDISEKELINRMGISDQQAVMFDDELFSFSDLTKYIYDNYDIDIIDFFLDDSSYMNYHSTLNKLKQSSFYDKLDELEKTLPVDLMEIIKKFLYGDIEEDTQIDSIKDLFD